MSYDIVKGTKLYRKNGSRTQDVSRSIRKYSHKRYQFFANFDAGIRLDQGEIYYYFFVQRLFIYLFFCRETLVSFVSLFSYYYYFVQLLITS